MLSIFSVTLSEEPRDVVETKLKGALHQKTAADNDQTIPESHYNLCEATV